MSYLSSKDIKNRLNCSSATLWRYQQPSQKIFKEPMPQPVKKASGSQNLWDIDHFEEWEHKYFRNSQ